MKYDVSICLPAHRTQLWQRLYESAAEAVGPYSWEMILVGPNNPPPFFDDKKNFKFLKDFGSPSRCAQIATMLAEGEFMMWGSNDGYFLKNSIRECISLKKNLDRKDVVIIRYAEGRGYTGESPPDEYWKAWTHPDLRLPGVPEDYMITLLSMFSLDYFRELGGWDCRFEHLNMNCHDLSFRVQRDGGTVHFSPNLVLTCDWNPNEGDHVAVQQAYERNDKFLFQQLYSEDQSDRIKLDYFNWTKSPAVWARRFGNG